MAIPSQIVLAERVPIGRWAASDSTYGAQASAWTPTTFAPGTRDLIAIATPDANPPPPSGTTTSRVAGAWRAISSPTVPAPATTSGSSKGGHERLALPLGEPDRLLRRLLVGAVDQVHLAAVAANRGHLGERRRDRHEQIRAATEAAPPPAPRPGHGCRRLPSRRPGRAHPARGGPSCGMRHGP